MNYYGKAAYWGIGNTTVGGIICNSLDVTSLNWQRTGQIEWLPDSQGEDRGAGVYNHGVQISISVMPTSSSVATVKSHIAQLVPVKGTTVNITSTDLPFTSGSFTGSYMVTEASLSRSNKGFATIDMTLEQRTAYDITPTIS